MARKKRAPKKGVVYLLYCQAEDWHMFKYGCSSRSVQRRIYYANSKLKEYGDGLSFDLLKAYESKDIFADERNVSFRLLDGGFACMSELFGVNEEDMDSVVANFEEYFENHRDVVAEVSVSLPKQKRARQDKISHPKQSCTSSNLALQDF